MLTVELTTDAKARTPLVLTGSRRGADRCRPTSDHPARYATPPAVVEQVIDERELLRLSRTGALDDLAEDVIVITDVPEIRVWRREED